MSGQRSCTSGETRPAASLGHRWQLAAVCVQCPVVVLGGELHPDASYVGGVGFAVPGDRDLTGSGPPFSL